MLFRHNRDEVAVQIRNSKADFVLLDRWSPSAVVYSQKRRIDLQQNPHFAEVCIYPDSISEEQYYKQLIRDEIEPDCVILLHDEPEVIC
jgi:thymidylate kinase